MTIVDWTWFRNGHPQNTLPLEPEHHVICHERLRSMALGRTTKGVKFTDL